MDETERLEAKGLARAKIRAKRRRASSIRRRTIRGSLGLFAIVWAIVFIQLVSGNDPALSRIPQKRQPPVAAAKPQPVREPETEAEAEAALEVERVPEEEFVEEPEVEAVPAEEAPVEVEPEAEAVPEPAPEPEPIVTSSS